ncbi:MAG: hypothetical protein E3J64_00040 [Anaerolineales bacterium]|nr:MAG: hypothetical protein E3J64_00040 [Anaerolineales bacterium]
MAEDEIPKTEDHAGDDQERRPPTNMRGYRGRTERSLIIGGFVILFIIGGGLAWLLYGGGAFVASWLCLGAGAVLLAALYLMFKRTE